MSSRAQQQRAVRHGCLHLIQVALREHTKTTGATKSIRTTVTNPFATTAAIRLLRAIATTIRLLRFFFLLFGRARWRRDSRSDHVSIKDEAQLRVRAVGIQQKVCQRDGVYLASSLQQRMMLSNGTIELSCIPKARLDGKEKLCVGPTGS